MRRVMGVLGCVMLTPVVIVVMILYGMGLLGDVDAALAAVEEYE